MGSRLQHKPSLGDRLFAWMLARFGPKAEWRFREHKERIFASLRDNKIHTVVEVGVGAAPNLKRYAAYVDRIIGVDLNSAMHQYARQAADLAGAAGKLSLITGAAEALPIEDGSADAVIMTHVLCSVRDPAQALAEVRRILRPGGVFIFLEHVAAPRGELLHTLQHVFNPCVGFFGHGCSATRHTLATIQHAGFASLQAESFRACLPGPAALAAPHIAGTAVR